MTTLSLILLYTVLYLLVFVLIDVGSTVFNPNPGKLLKTDIRDNIVAHIYNENTSYKQYILSFKRLFFFPFYLIGSLFGDDTFHLCTEKIVVNYSGYIKERNNRFTVIWYKEDSPSCCIWENLFNVQFFPTWKKIRHHSCWTTNEGDCVEYIPTSKMEKNSSVALTRHQFLEITKQTQKEFECNESIKYSGC